MKLFRILVLSCLLSTAPVFAATNLTTSTSGEDQGHTEAPDGYVFIEGNEFADLNRLPLDLLADARRKFRNANFLEAAIDIRTADKFMKIQAEGSPRSADLQEAADRLDRLSKNVSSGGVRALATLDSELNQSAQAEANHLYRHASEAWARHMNKNVGSDLGAAANAIERSAEWSGRSVTPGEDGVVDATKALSKKLISGRNWTADEVGKSLASLGHEIGLLGLKMESDTHDTK